MLSNTNTLILTNTPAYYGIRILRICNFYSTIPWSTSMPCLCYLSNVSFNPKHITEIELQLVMSYTFYFYHNKGQCNKTLLFLIYEFS